MKPMMVLAGVALFALAAPAKAAEARCYTTDDGEYPCQFKALDAAGSFEIVAEGYPSFQLWIDEPGIGSASAVFHPGGGSVSLPGRYIRSSEDSACWVSDVTDTEICAW
jgi:hypothetical protein